MSEFNWEKTPDKVKNDHKLKRGAQNERRKFMIGGLLILGAVIYLIVSGTLTGAQYFISVEEVVSNPEYLAQNVRITGAVIGDSIDFDAETGKLDFTIASLPDQYADLGLALHEAVDDPTRLHLTVYMEGQVKPDLLKHEAQAILTGKMGTDGIFYATELNLKCPSRFEDNEIPDLAAEKS